MSFKEIIESIETTKEKTDHLSGALIIAEIGARVALQLPLTLEQKETCRSLYEGYVEEMEMGFAEELFPEIWEYILTTNLEDYPVQD